MVDKLAVAVRSQPETEGRPVAYGLTFRLEHKDGIPAEPPSIRSAPGVTWRAGDTIPLGRDRKLRVIDTPLDEGTDGDPVSVPVVERD